MKHFKVLEWLKVRIHLLILFTLKVPDHDDTAFGAGTLTWQDPVHSSKAGPGEVMTVEIYLFIYQLSGIVIKQNFEERQPVSRIMT